MPTPTIEEPRTTDQHPPAAPREHTIGVLIRELRDDMMTLVRQQFDLGRKEMSEKFSRLSRNLSFLIIGSVVGLTGLIFLSHSLTQAVENWLIVGGVSTAVVQWLAPLIVGGGLLIIGAAFLIKAVKTFSHPHLNLDHTMHSVKEDIQWAQKRKR